MTVDVIERSSHVTPVGVRLVDVMTGRTEADEIEVRFVRSRRALPITAFRTPSGVFAAHWVCGLREWELPRLNEAGDAVHLAVTPRPFRLEVRDRSGRFFSFAVDGVPMPSAGLLVALGDSPPGSPPAPGGALPLFSRPGRPAPASTAVIRARLLHHTGEPAAHAALEVTPAPDLPPVRGIADERGEVAAMFPYPKPPGFAGSPPTGSRRPLRETQWKVTYRVLTPVAGSPPDDGDLPQLSTFLDQAPATFAVLGSPPGPAGEHTLVYGRETSLPTLLVGA